MSRVINLTSLRWSGNEAVDGNDIADHFQVSVVLVKWSKRDFSWRHFHTQHYGLKIRWEPNVTADCRSKIYSWSSHH